MAHRPAIARAYALLFFFAPLVAEACPACVGNQKFNATLKLLGLFLTVPFALFIAVVWAIRNAQRHAAHSPVDEPRDPNGAVVPGDPSNL